MACSRPLALCSAIPCPCDRQVSLRYRVHHRPKGRSWQVEARGDAIRSLPWPNLLPCYSGQGYDEEYHRSAQSYHELDHTLDSPHVGLGETGQEFILLKIQVVQAR